MIVNPVGLPADGSKLLLQFPLLLDKLFSVLSQLLVLFFRCPYSLTEQPGNLQACQLLLILQTIVLFHIL